MFNLRIFAAYFAQFLKTRLAYRWDFLAGIGSNILVAVTGLLFVVLVMDGEKVTELSGWSRAEVLFIYGYSMLSMTVFSLIAINLYSFGDRYVIQGEFDRVLLRPVNSLCQVLFESFNLDAIGSFLVGVAVLAYSSQQLSISLGLLDLAWLFISGVSGGVILIAVFVVLSSVSFHFEDRMGIAPPFYNMIAFGRYPLPIFSRTLQFLLSWVIPFGFVAFYPATHFFSRTGFEFFCYLTPVVALVSLSIAWCAWQFGVANYSSTGN